MDRKSFKFLNRNRPKDNEKYKKLIEIRKFFSLLKCTFFWDIYILFYLIKFCSISPALANNKTRTK